MSGPGSTFGRAWEEARRLGHSWVGEPHVLLALARAEGPVGEVLHDAGATPEALETQLQGLLGPDDPATQPRDQAESPAFNPGLYQAMGRAEGLALADGRESPEPGDVLVALLWPAMGFAPGVLHRLGIDRSALLRSFAERGGTVPPGEPEPLDLTPKKRIDVPYEQLMMIVRKLPARLPDPTRFGFNLHNETERAWIWVDEDVDAESLLEELLAGKR